jgi:hypothetical protein
LKKNNHEAHEEHEEINIEEKERFTAENAEKNEETYQAKYLLKLTIDN